MYSLGGERHRILECEEGWPFCTEIAVNPSRFLIASVAWRFFLLGALFVWLGLGTACRGPGVGVAGPAPRSEGQDEILVLALETVGSLRQEVNALLPARARMAEEITRLQATTDEQHELILVLNDQRGELLEKIARLDVANENLTQQLRTAQEDLQRQLAELTAAGPAAANVDPTRTYQSLREQNAWLKKRLEEFRYRVVREQSDVAALKDELDQLAVDGESGVPQEERGAKLVSAAGKEAEEPQGREALLLGVFAVIGLVLLAMLMRDPARRARWASFLIKPDTSAGQSLASAGSAVGQGTVITDSSAASSTQRAEGDSEIAELDRIAESVRAPQQGVMPRSAIDSPERLATESQDSAKLEQRQEAGTLLPADLGSVLAVLDTPTEATGEPELTVLSGGLQEQQAQAGSSVPPSVAAPSAQSSSDAEPRGRSDSAGQTVDGVDCDDGQHSQAATEAGPDQYSAQLRAESRSEATSPLLGEPEAPLQSEPTQQIPDVSELLSKTKESDRAPASRTQLVSVDSESLPAARGIGNDSSTVPDAPSSEKTLLLSNSTTKSAPTQQLPELDVLTRGQGKTRKEKRTQLLPEARPAQQAENTQVLPQLDSLVSSNLKSDPDDAQPSAPGRTQLLPPGPSELLEHGSTARPPVRVPGEFPGGEQDSAPASSVEALDLDLAKLLTPPAQSQQGEGDQAREESPRRSNEEELADDLKDILNEAFDETP